MDQGVGGLISEKRWAQMLPSRFPPNMINESEYKPLIVLRETELFT